MIRRWILYLAVLLGVIIFNWAYQDWFSQLALLGVLWLPAVCLVMSLPAMLLTKIGANVPNFLPLGSEQKASLSAWGKLPAPPFAGRVRVTRVTTGESWTLKKKQPLPAEHCGYLQCDVVRGRVYDYLGLFLLPARTKDSIGVTIRPKAEKVEQLPQLERYISTSWRPKAGGGFAENHELRLYRPGDNLTQIHWKLSAKTGKYIVREALEPIQGRLMLEMILRGDAATLDQKFGRLVGLSDFLLQRGLHHELRVLTGTGIQNFNVDCKEKQEEAVDMLLGMPPAPKGAEMEVVSAAWRLRIGGADDEA